MVLIDDPCYGQDRVVFSSNGDNTTLFYFYISVDTGLICVRQPLFGPSQTEYRVGIATIQPGTRHQITDLCKAFVVFRLDFQIIT
jgi:hypothetical protein